MLIMISTSYDICSLALLISAIFTGFPFIESAFTGTPCTPIALSQDNPVVTITGSNSEPDGPATRCIWNITSPDDTRVIIRFNDLNLHNGDKLVVSSDRTFFQVADTRIQLHPLYSDVNNASIMFHSAVAVGDSTVTLEVAYGDGVSQDDILLLSGGYIDLDESRQSLTIKSPEFTDTSHDVYLDIHYVVIAPTDSKIHVAYDKLAIGDGVDLSVYDGIFTKKLISNFSGFGEEGPIPQGNMLSSNAVTFRLYSDWQYPADGFQITISVDESLSHSGSCGGVIPLSDAMSSWTFTTPFYEQPLANHFDLGCRWYITSPSDDKQVQLVFHEVKTELDEPVSVFDHSSTLINSISTISGHLNSECVILSSQEGLIIRYGASYTSNDMGRGFRAEVRILDATPSTLHGTCGGTLALTDVSPSVTFVSPEFDSAADIKMDFWLKFTSPVGNQVLVTFQEIQTNQEEITMSDSLTSNTFAMLSGTVTGGATTLSSQGQLTLTYNDLSDVYNGQGFTAEAQIFQTIPSDIEGICGGRISLSDDFPLIRLPSPLYGISSGADALTDCWNYITSPADKRVLLTFMDVDTSANEAITIYDDPNSASNQIAYIKGKVERNVTMYSSSGGLSIHYHDGSSTSNGQGYLCVAQLLVEQPSKIPQLGGGKVSLTSDLPNVFFSTPGALSTEDLLLDIWIHIECPPGQQVQLTITSLETKVNEWVYIADNKENWENDRISSLSGTLVSPNSLTVYSSKGGLTIFYDDRSETSNGVGFTAEARLMTDQIPDVESGFCGGVVPLDPTRPSFEFTTPLYNGSLDYYIQMECWMYFNTSPDGQVTLQLDNIGTVPSNNEDIEVYDYSITPRRSTLVSRLSGTFPQNIQYSSTRGGVYVHYNATHLGRNGHGFGGEAYIMDAESTSKPSFSHGVCGFSFTLTEDRPSINISSLLYGRSVTEEDADTDCWMYIKSSEGRQVKLIILDLQTSINEEISLYDNPTSSTNRIAHLYGTLNSSITLLSSRGGLILEYEDKNDSYNRPGFLAEAHLIEATPKDIASMCGGVLTLNESLPLITFATPLYNYHIYKDLYMDCSMFFRSPTGKQVKLTITRMVTVNEGITIYNHPSSSSSLYCVNTLSGTMDAPLQVISSRGGLTLIFDDRVFGPNGPGIQGDAQILDKVPSSVPGFCGGVMALTDATPHVTFSTPLLYYRTNEDVIIDCKMHITSPVGKQVKLTITHVDTIHEQIKIYDDPSSTSSSHLVTYFYGQLEKSVTIRSSRGGLTITFADQSYEPNGGGFYATAETFDSVPTDEPGFCGGVVALSDTSPVFTFSTPHFDNPDSSGIYMDCWMYFTCPQGKQVQFRIQGMETKSDANKGVTIYDHQSSTSNTYMVAHLSGVQPDTDQYYISSRAGFTITYDDVDAVDSENGKGMFAEALIVDGIPSGQTLSCGGTIPLSHELPHVSFSTPTFHHPLNTDADNDCVVYITSAPGKQVRLTLKQVSTTPNEVIKVYDHSPNSRDRNLLLNVHGTLTKKASMYSTRGGLVLTYTDSSTGLNGPGFYAEAFVLDEVATYQSASCGGSVFLSDSFPRVYATTPFFFRSPPTDIDMECRWYLISQSNQQIQLTLKEINIKNEIINIYDHPTSMINEVHNLAQTTDEVSLMSEQRGFIMDFTDESASGNGRGFFFDARLEGTEGNITIPDEPIQTTAITTSKPNSSSDFPAAPKSTGWRVHVISVTVSVIIFVVAILFVIIVLVVIYRRRGHHDSETMEQNEDSVNDIISSSHQTGEDLGTINEVVPNYTELNDMNDAGQHHNV